MNEIFYFCLINSFSASLINIFLQTYFDALSVQQWNITVEWSNQSILKNKRFRGRCCTTSGYLLNICECIRKWGIRFFFFFFCLISAFNASITSAYCKHISIFYPFLFDFPVTIFCDFVIEPYLRFRRECSPNVFKSLDWKNSASYDLVLSFYLIAFLQQLKIPNLKPIEKALKQCASIALNLKINF